MKKWEEDLVQYRLFPAPPRKPLNEYIRLYLDGKDEKYLSWFLHYFEPQLNTRIMALVQNYAMQGHFVDMKSAYITGLVKALNSYDVSRGVDFMQYKEYIVLSEVLEYIRTMRTGITIPSEHEYKQLRKMMLLFNNRGRKSDDETIEYIAKKTGTTAKTVKEMLTAGLRSEGMVPFFKRYGDEDSEQAAEDVTCDNTLSPEQEFFRLQTRIAVLSSYEELSPRQRYILAHHLGFCENCYKHKDSISFIEIAVNNGLSSAEAAEKAYRKAIKELAEKVKEKNVL